MKKFSTRYGFVVGVCMLVGAVQASQPPFLDLGAANEQYIQTCSLLPKKQQIKAQKLFLVRQVLLHAEAMRRDGSALLYNSNTREIVFKDRSGADFFYPLDVVHPEQAGFLQWTLQLHIKGNRSYGQAYLPIALHDSFAPSEKVTLDAINQKLKDLEEINRRLALEAKAVTA